MPDYSYDPMGEMMKVIRMMEFMRTSRLEKERREAGLGRAIEDPRAREDIESLPADLRPKAIESYLHAKNIPESQWGDVRTYLQSPSHTQQVNIQKFMAEMENAKYQLARIQQGPARIERLLNSSWAKGMTQEEKDAILIPERENAHDLTQHLIGSMSRLGIDAFVSDPNDARFVGAINELKKTAALGLGAGEEYGGQHRTGGPSFKPQLPGQQPGQLGPAPTPMGGGRWQQGGEGFQNPTFQDPRSGLMIGASRRLDMPLEGFPDEEEQ